MNKLILFIGMYFFIPSALQAQCPAANYSFPDSICAFNPTSVVNTSSGASTYQWNFCGGAFSKPDVYAIDDPSTPMGATSISLIWDSTNWYGFLFNQQTMTITRYDYGNSLDNVPTTFDLGNPDSAITGNTFWNNMSFVKEANNWYGVFGLYSTHQIVLMSFGASLNNPTPSASVFSSPSLHGNIFFEDLKIDNGNIFLFIPGGAAQVYRLNYGNSITNTPVVDAIDLSANYQGFADISIVKNCNHWYAFLPSYSTGTVVRLDLGDSLNTISSNITVTDLGNPASLISAPWSMKMAYDGNQWYAFEVNFGASFNRINFGRDLSNPTLTCVNQSYTPAINGYGGSVSVVQANSAQYLFLCNGATVFSEVKYEPPCSASIQTSSQKNPVVEYDSGGTYLISLTALDSTGNVNYYVDSVIVSPSPTANFSFQNTCFNDTTKFQDLSYFNQGTITGRHWDFGDGNTDSIANPSHIYSLPGKYAVTLTLSGNNGCNTPLTDTVIIGAVPTANFSETVGCSNVPVNFTDLSTVGFGDSIVNWHWDFGNGDSSVFKSPVYEYPSGGNYTVILTVTTNRNCTSDTSFALAIYNAPHAGYYAINTCLDSTVSFIDSSTIAGGGINDWHWDFGDGDTSLLQNPSHVYPNSVSNYSVTLIAKAADGCSDTVTAPLKINHVPTASFTYTPATLCEGNTINFTDQSSVSGGDTIYAWHWDFGNGDISILKNPVYAFPAYGTYTVVLTVYSQTSCGASDSATVNVIQSPTAGFTFNSSCLGDSIHFYDASIAPGGTSIAAWHWDFGDGDTSILQNPAHQYDAAGVYTVTLLVTNSTGCVNSYVTTDTVHGLPMASFAGTHGCTSSNFVFLNTSTSNYGAISISSWNFGDPASGSNDTSTSFNAQHIYYQPGNYPVSLIITTVYGCTDTVALADTVYQTSVANFQYLPTCEQAQMIFTNLDSISGIDSTWSWSFGDGGVSYIQSPSHYYFLPGVYNVTLSVISNDGCPSSITKQVQVSPTPVASFVTAPACINEPYSFQDISTVSTGTVQKWYWTFGNGDSSYIQSPQTIYTDTGDYIVSLTVTADTTSAACTNTVTQVIHVYPLPNANFNYNPTFGSPPLKVNFNDLSTGAAQYLWEFGDGDTSALPSPSHTYTDTGKFSITQVVYSAEGCVDSMTKSIYVITPRLDIAVTAVSYQLSNNLFKVSARIANLGTEDINNYDMLASIQDGATIDEHVNVLLPSGPAGIITYTFYAAFEVSAEQNINYYCVSALNPNGQTDDVPSNNEKCATLSTMFSVAQPYPNPFSDQLNLQFIIPFRGQVTVDLFDNIGQEIGTLYNNIADEGGTTFQVSTAALANGTFFCRFIFNNDQTLVYPIVKMAQKK